MDVIPRSLSHHNHHHHHHNHCVDYFTIYQDSENDWVPVLVTLRNRILNTKYELNDCIPQTVVYTLK